MVVFAIDPGSHKSGLAVVSAESGLLCHAVVPVDNIASTCAAWAQKYAFDYVIIGGSTCSKRVRDIVEETLHCSVQVVDERYTTERAKVRYFEVNTPRGWHRFVPAGLRYPPEPFDDFAAVVMAEDYIKSRRK